MFSWSPVTCWNGNNLNGDNCGQNNDRLSQNGEKATSQNGDHESLYLYGLTKFGLGMHLFSGIITTVWVWCVWNILLSYLSNTLHTHCWFSTHGYPASIAYCVLYWLLVVDGPSVVYMATWQIISVLVVAQLMCNELCMTVVQDVVIAACIISVLHARLFTKDVQLLANVVVNYN